MFFQGTIVKGCQQNEKCWKSFLFISLFSVFWKAVKHRNGNSFFFFFSSYVSDALALLWHFKLITLVHIYWQISCVRLGLKLNSSLIRSSLFHCKSQAAIKWALTQMDEWMIQISCEWIIGTINSSVEKINQWQQNKLDKTIFFFSSRQWHTEAKFLHSLSKL